MLPSSVCISDSSSMFIPGKGRFDCDEELRSAFTNGGVNERHEVDEDACTVLEGAEIALVGESVEGPWLLTTEGGDSEYKGVFRSRGFEDWIFPLEGDDEVPDTEVPSEEDKL